MGCIQRLRPVLVIIVALMTVAITQDTGLQDCQGQCITDMTQQANNFGCSAGDILCACNSKGFLPGLYDCANKACPAGTDNSSLISYESHICSAASTASTSSGGFSATLIPSLSTSMTAASSSPLTTASLTGGATVTIFTQPPPAQTSSTITSSSTSSGGLSTGAKAGIGIGVSIGALLVVGLFAFFCFRQRRRKPMRVDSFHARTRPEYSREEIHGSDEAFANRSFPEMNEAQMHTQPKYEIPPLPEKSRARAFSGESFGAGALGRHPSERNGYKNERYSWSTDPRSEGNGYGGSNGLGMSPVSPVSPVRSEGFTSELSRSPTIGGPEYGSLSAPRRPSSTYTGD